MEEQARTVFEIPAENLPKFEAQLAKLSRKAEKLIGMPLKHLVFSHSEKTLADGLPHRVYSVMLSAPALKVDGYTFVARLDHSNDTGTIVRMVPNTGIELPAHYREAKSTTCDHCGHRRYRRDTFVVCSEAGEFKQIGSTCLKDFFGHDPSKIAKMAELLGYANECGQAASEWGVEGLNPRDYRWISVEEFAQATARSVMQRGWTSSKAAYENPSLTATRHDAWEIYFNDMRHVPATDAEIDLAERALQWAASLREKAEPTDYEHNIMVIAEATMIETRNVGLLASIVGVFFNNEIRAQQGSRSVDVGDFSGVISLMKHGASKLKHPKVRLALPDGSPVVLTIAGPNAKVPGSVNITDGGPYGANTWYGRVSPTGQWDKSKSVYGGTMTALTTLLADLAKDPAGVASAYGKLTGNCCFCCKPLNDARSLGVGYGKVCADKYGLSWGVKAARIAKAA
jgi:hypothetical protein